MRGALALMACLAVACPAYALEGRVVGVADGDSITVLVGGKGQIKVRLYGIDCLERRQDYGKRARAYTRKALLGKAARIVEIGRDRYGRVLGIVTGPQGEANRALVSAGLAWVYEQYCKRPECAQWRQEQAAAQDARRGLWRDKHAVPPWEWRRGVKRP